MSNLNFFFHESFPPQIIYLAELLKLAKEEFVGSKFEISNVTGIPTGEKSGKVEPHVKYLEYMGLIESKLDSGKINLKLTDLGEIVYSEDQYLMQDATKQLLHYNLTRKEKGAPQWSFLFREYPYDFDVEINFSKIVDNGKLIYGKDIYAGPLKASYTKGDFESISPVEFLDKDIIYKSCYIRYECNKIYAYTLLNELENRGLGNNEITLNTILEDIKWQKGFGFDYETTLEVLDELNHLGVIKLNKQLNPMTVIPNRESKDILTEIYDSLI